MMREGERQVAETLDGIRRDHLARYEFAARILPPGSRVIDFACGIGYGSKILSDAGHGVIGYDVDKDAIGYAREHYDHPRSGFVQKDGNVPGELGEAGAAVCFETIEHIEDPRPLLKALRVSAPLLIASVPNEAVMPFIDDAHPGGYLYHFRHYTKHEFKALLQGCGWYVTDWYGQEGPESEVEPNMNGRTLIVVAQRDELPEEREEPGKHVAILGLGPSLDQYLEITKRQGGRHKFCDEVWAINALGDVLACDLVFHMDDIRIQEIRAKAAPASNIAAMVSWIKTSRVPVVTSRAHPDYPALVEYPLEDVLNHLGHDYFNSTAAYAVAFAIHIGVTKLSVFGADFTYPKAHDAEKGRGCVEYWLGQAAARGIKLSMPKTSTLMDACYSRADRLYGYDTQDVIFDIQQNGKVTLSFKERENLPTAEELEARYDHSVHTNAIVAAASGKE
jgi:hypothetical protein